MTEDSESSVSKGRTDTQTQAQVSDPYKILGDLSNPSDGIGVLGRNTASSGTTIGVEGRVNSPSGYGLATPDDAQVGGTAELNALAGNLTGNTAVTDLVGPGLTITSGSLDANGAGEANSGTNLGNGEGLYANKSGSTLEFKSLVGGSNISLSSNSSEVTAGLTNNAISVSAGNKLSGGGSTSLGGTTAVGVQPLGAEVFIDGQRYGDADMGMWVDVLFDKIVADEGNGFEIETNRYTILEAGDYDVDLNLNWSNLGGTLLEARIQTDIQEDPLMYTNMNTPGSHSF